MRCGCVGETQWGHEVRTTEAWWWTHEVHYSILSAFLKCLKFSIARCKREQENYTWGYIYGTQIIMERTTFTCWKWQATTWVAFPSTSLVARSRKPLKMAGVDVRLLQAQGFLQTRNTGDLVGMGAGLGEPVRDQGHFLVCLLSLSAPSSLFMVCLSVSPFFSFSTYIVFIWSFISVQMAIPCSTIQTLWV